MPDLISDDFWREYESAADAHRRAMEARLGADQKLVGNHSREALERWNNAHQEEDRCYEQLKAAERVIWAKYKES